MKLPSFFKRTPKPRTTAKPWRRRTQTIYLLAVATVAGVFSYATYVTYQLVDRTLTASEAVIRLRPEVAPEPFHAEDVRQVTTNAEAKRNVPEPPDWTTIANPFHEGRSGSPRAPDEPAQPVIP